MLSTIACPATRPGESRRPTLWQGLATMWAPCLQRGVTDSDPTVRLCSVPDLGYNKLGVRKSGGGLYAPSPYGGSLKFSGAGGGYFEESGSTSLFNFVHKVGVFSAVALLRSDAVSTFSTILDNSNGTTSNSGFLFYQSASGMVGIQAYRSSAGNTVFNSLGSTALVAGQWTLCVIKGDGSNVSVWQNGHKSGSDVAVGTLGSANATYAPGLGSYGGGTNSNVWNGQIAYLGMWSRCLGDAEVRDLTSDPLILFRRNIGRVGKAAAAATFQRRTSSFLVF